MPPLLKNILQYAFILGLTVLLIWVSLRGLRVEEGENKWDYLVATWNRANKGWLLAMAGVAMSSHFIRAERWRMLLVPAGSHNSWTASFLSLMIGYLINLVVPRGGEVSRCYNLYKLENTPVELSFGTVVAERVIDLICLLVLLIIAFIVEADKLFSFIDTLPISLQNGESKLPLIGVILLALLFITGLAIFFIRRNQRLRTFAITLWQGFRKGLLTVFQLKNPVLFIIYTILIWALYFLMSFTVILAFPATETLGLGAVLSLFAIGAIAMAAPLPGGTGSYHALVPAGLTFLYAIAQTDAVAFTFIFHAWQTLLMIAAGALSLLVTSILMRRKSKQKLASEIGK